jgi:hypothetical protein
MDQAAVINHIIAKDPQIRAPAYDGFLYRGVVLKIESLPRFRRHEKIV